MEVGRCWKLLLCTSIFTQLIYNFIYCTYDFVHFIQTAAGDGNVFLVGNNLTLADIVFFPYLAYVIRLGFKADEKFPSLARYYNLMLTRKSVQDTWPPHWRESAPPPALFVR